MFVKKNFATGVVIAASTALMLTACGGSGDDNRSQGFDDCQDFPAECNSGPRRDGEEVVWALDASWNSWSEVHSSFGAAAGDVISPVFPRTGTFHPDGEWVLNSALFEKEPELINEDPMEVEYFLKEGANWGDGNPIGLDDFIYNWYAWSGDPDMCDQDLCSPRSGAWGPNVEQISETDEGTIVVRYVDGYLTPEWKFAAVLTNPAHLAEQYGFEDWKTDPTVMGESLVNFVNTVPEYSAGPYKIVDAEMGDYVRFEINQDYLGDTQPVLSNIRMEYFADTSAIITEMRQGTVHGATPGRHDPDDISALRSSSGFRYNVAPGPGWSHIDLNMNNQFLQDKQLRRAVLVAFDIEQVLDRTVRLSHDQVEVRGNHIFPTRTDYYVDYVTSTGQGSGDVFFASEILEDADYYWEQGKLFTPDGEQVTLEYRLPTEGINSQVQAELFQSVLGEIGIEVTLVTYEPSDLTEVLMGAQFDVIGFQWISSPTFASAPSQFWHSTSNSNFGNLENENIDELVQSVLQTTDMDEAAARANAAVEAVVEEAYVLPITDNPVLVMVHEDLVNVRDNWASQQRGLYNIEEWGWLDEGSA
ncbi:ABC transporter substrate-binding protein [Natronoglycomyces albus]|uniref:Solute-binding protein family 5 domain-containing protein n=1 Tax=Natronoglycomyces albus TaxID=2811108 RepID=A0A895XH82_9ACTN|nr:ABC transporter substrate-binding protein [Natronoglycomyces albus]QSB04704.1 hypothetical protein JQS30_13130 [Natronoglycomyces albus]